MTAGAAVPATARPGASPRALRGTLLLGAGLAAVTAIAWVQTVRDASSMSMPGAAPSAADGALFTLEWGVMMAAMMLPSATPMILLYRTVSRRLSARGERVLPPVAFAAVYLLLWLATGVPVYGAHVAVARAAAAWPRFDTMIPYAIAGVLAVAGIYQFTEAKRACLRHCESPLGYLMRRWKDGYVATLRLAVAHAGYCVGCCWGLMLILVAAGAMSLPWVLAITAVVFAEKVLPRGWRTAQVVGAALLVFALAVAIRPGLVRAMRPAMAQGSGTMDHATMDHAAMGH